MSQRNPPYLGPQRDPTGRARAAKGCGVGAARNGGIPASVTTHTRTLADVRPTCAWPECGRAPDVCVEYLPGRPRDLQLVWLRSEHGLVNLCGWHAAELPGAFGSGRSWSDAATVSEPTSPALRSRARQCVRRRKKPRPRVEAEGQGDLHTTSTAVSAPSSLALKTPIVPQVGRISWPRRGLPAPATSVRRTGATTEHNVAPAASDATPTEESLRAAREAGP